MAQNTPSLYFRRNGKQFGPFSFEDFKSLCRDKKLKTTDQVSHAVDGPWQSLEKSFQYILDNKGGLPPTAKRIDDHTFDDIGVDQVVPQSPTTPIPSNPNLKPCPDCGRSVSIRAPSCPDCGAPLTGKDTECRLTIGLADQPDAYYALDAKLDGRDLFSLEMGEKGTARVSPGNHTLTGTISGMFGLFPIRNEISFVIERGMHVQLEADVVGMFPPRLTFHEVFFEGHYEY